MKNKTSKEVYLTKAEFLKEAEITNAKIDRVALSLLDTQEKVKRIEETMATKSDVNLILDRIDYLTKRVVVFDRKVLVHDLRINELEPKVEDHEKRLTILESPK